MPPKSPTKAPFWKTKTLAELTPKEWESLCDGCARCCLNKYEDEDTKEIRYTDVACKLLDTQSCRCSDYLNRTEKVPDCVVLTREILPEMNCLPPTCGYRLVHEGKDLYDWHPLISGDKSSVHAAGISVRGRVVSESGMTEAQIEARLVRWPMSKRARRPRA